MAKSQRGRVKPGPVSRRNSSNSSGKDSRLSGRSGPRKRSGK
jgi:hypothetical protein